MTEAERKGLERKWVNNHGLSSQQVRSVNNPVNKNNEIKDEVRNIAAALETDEEIERGDSIVISTIKYNLQCFLSFQNYYWFRFVK